MICRERKNPGQPPLKTVKKKEVYAGDERRSSGRAGYPPEIESLLRDMKGIICAANNCLFTESQQDTVKHLDGMYGDLGGGKPSHGIEIHREATKHVEGVRAYLRDAKKFAWKIIVSGAVIFAGYALWYAFLREIGRGNG